MSAVLGHSGKDRLNRKRNRMWKVEGDGIRQEYMKAGYGKKIRTEKESRRGEFHCKSDNRVEYEK